MGYLISIVHFGHLWLLKTDLSRHTVYTISLRLILGVSQLYQLENQALCDI